MIKKLDENYRKEALEFLSQEPSINLFAIGDIENFGFEEDFQDIWGHFHNGLIDGILLRFTENFIPYWNKDNFNPEEFKDIIRNSPVKRKMISGKKTIVDKFDNIFKNHIKRDTYFCELSKADILLKDMDGVKLASVSDKYRVPKFLNSIQEFKDSPDVSPEQFEKKLSTKSGRTYYIENSKGEIISIAQTTAENSISAMVVGVSTRPDYRRKGLAQKCMSKLCLYYLRKGKTLCLFYDNPEAGKIYKNIGFKQIEKWTILRENNLKKGLIK